MSEDEAPKTERTGIVPCTFGTALEHYKQGQVIARLAWPTETFEIRNDSDLDGLTPHDILSNDWYIVRPRTVRS